MATINKEFSIFLKILALFLFTLNTSLLSQQQWQKLTLNPSTLSYCRSFINDGTNIYLSTATGLYKSTDGGINFNVITLNPPYNSTACNTFILSGAYIFCGSISGVLGSSDKGNTWSPFNNGFSKSPNPPEVKVFGITKDQKKIYAGTMNQLYCSTDNGSNWSSINGPGLNDNVIQAIAISNTSVYLGTPSGIYRSSDDGTSWNKMNNGLGNNASTINTSSLFVNDSYIYAGNQTGVFRSSDNGSTWTNVSSGSPTIIAVNTLTGSGSTIFAGLSGGGVYYSTNNGGNWNSLNTGLTENSSKYINGLYVSNVTIYAGTNSGAYSRNISDIIISAPTSTSATNVTQTSFTANWVSVNGATGYYLDVATDNGFTNYVSGFNSKNVFNVTSYSVTGLTTGTTYYYRVRSFNTGGTTSSSSNIITVMTSPAATQATNLTHTSFTANWESVSAATGYYLDVATDNNFTTFVTGFNSKNVANVKFYQVSELKAGTTYYYRVRYYNTVGTSEYSNTITVTTLPSVLSPPEATSATNLTQTSFTANWGSVSGATGYYLDVANDNTFSHYVTGFVSKDVSNLTSYPVTGLTNGTIYYYRVRYYNTDGTSGNSNTITTTTIPNVLSPPVATAATNLTQTSFTANWGSVSGATGYYLDVAIDNSFTNYVTGFGSKDVSNFTSYLVTGLTTGTNYYYRVRSYSAAGTSGNSNTIPVTTSFQTQFTVSISITPPGSGTTTGASTYNSGSSITITAIANSGYRFINWTENGAFISSNSSYTFTINGNRTLVATFMANQITVNQSYSFANSYSQSSYKLIGLPGDNNFPLSDIITGSLDIDWVAYRDNGQTSNYYIKYDGSSNFYIKPGVGFWVLSKNTINVNRTVTSVTVNSNGQYIITPLPANWSIISNPFSISVPWNSIVSKNPGISSDVPWDYSNGTFAVSPETIDPYKAYYFKNTNGLSQLTIPYPTLAKKSNANNELLSNELTISLNVENRNISEVKIGFNTESKVDYDKYDIYKPVSDFETERIVIYNSALSSSDKYLYRDIRSGELEEEKYILKLKVVPNKQYTISITDTSKNNFVYLIDNKLNVVYDLKQDNKISFSSNTAEKNYELIYSKKELNTNSYSKSLPLVNKLYQNYPNPFNPSTTIRYSVDTRSNVSIKIYNTLGAEVKELLNGYVDKGYYEMTFDGKELPSGVYFCRLRTDQKVEVIKMLLVK